MAAWQLRTSGGRRGLRLAAVTLGCGLAAVSPWTLRNYRLTGEVVPIETVSIFNLWNDNAFVDEGHWGRQARLIDRQGTSAGKQAEALHFALLGWRRDPDAGLRKMIDGLEYFLRPTGAHELLIAETPRASWHHLLAIVFGDLLFALAVALAASCAIAGPRSPARTLLLLWLSYYLLLLVVVFHTQVRYRTPFTPILFACAVGGWCVLANGSAGVKRRAVVGLLAGIALISWASLGELRAASRAMASAWTLRAAEQALAAGDADRAAALVGRAAERDPASARPYARYGRWLVAASKPAEAIEAYEQAVATKPGAWLPLVILPRLLADVGRSEDSERSLVAAHAFSGSANPWLALEAAWWELPPPRTDEVRVGGLDYGAVRGFMSPESGHRWSRARAWLRLRPTLHARRYDMTIEMGSPDPSPLASPAVSVRIDGGPWARLVIDRELRSYHLQAAAPRDGVLVVELAAPTWSLPGLPAELGVRVSRIAVAPLR